MLIEFSLRRIDIMHITNLNFLQIFFRMKNCVIFGIFADRKHDISISNIQFGYCTNMASNLMLFYTCTLLFLQCLNSQVGNAQRYSYDLRNIVEKYTEKELEVARPFIDNAIDSVFTQFKPSNGSSNTTSECVKTLAKLTKNFTSLGSTFPCEYKIYLYLCILALTVYKTESDILNVMISNI